MIIALALTLIVGSPPPDNVCALIERQTQEFSDAGLTGDTAAMNRLLDNAVIFFNEGGDSATKADLIGGASPQAKSATTTLTVTAFNCRVHGNVAVGSFIDSLSQ